MKLNKELDALKEEIRTICKDSDYLPTEKVNLIYALVRHGVVIKG